MKRPTEEITLAEYHALGKRTKPKRAPKADIPRAGPAERTGLSTMLKDGWQWTHNPRYGYRLDKGGLTSGWHPDERSAVTAARVALRAGIDKADPRCVVTVEWSER